MHSGYEIPGIQQHQQAENNSYGPVLISMNQTHVLDQIHTQQRLFIDQTHFLPPHYVGGASNLMLGLNNEICARNDDYTNKDGSNIDQLHCCRNQPPPPLWKQLTVTEVSNENSEIVYVRSDHMEINNSKEQVPADDYHHLTACLDSKNRLHFGELGAIYKRLGAITQSNVQTGPCQNNLPVNPARLPEGFDHAEEAPTSNGTNKKRKKKSKKASSHVSPTAEFFGSLVKQVLDHQENMHKKFAQVIERLEDERKAREEDWRKQELERFEQESEVRAREKESAKDREAMIVSYLEKITGQRIRFTDFD